MTPCELIVWSRGFCVTCGDAAIVAKVNDVLYDLNRPLETDAKVQILTPKLEPARIA